MRRWFKPDVLLGIGAFLFAFVLVVIKRATIIRGAKGIDLVSWQMLHELRPYLWIAAAIMMVLAVAGLIVDWKKRRDQSDPNARDP